MDTASKISNAKADLEVPNRTLIHCVLMDRSGLPIESFDAHSVDVDGRGQALTADRGVRAGERLRLNFEHDGHWLAVWAVSRTVVPVLQPGAEPEYLIGFDVEPRDESGRQPSDRQHAEVPLALF